MITFTQGNLLESDAEALVNTVNTVGVMGKGIALMFKERFARNFRLYADACKASEVVTGTMFVTEIGELTGPRWIINFPTKRHWRAPSRIEWVEEGLRDLRRVLEERGIGSVAIPPLGAGNGGLKWSDVRACIENELGDLDIDVIVFEPVTGYLNPPKAAGVRELTPARALVAELVRRYQALDMECSLLEIQKLAWLLERAIELHAPSERALGLRFEAGRYGPYSDRLRHLLDALDGSYLRCDKRIADADRSEPIWFDRDRADTLDSYLSTGAQGYLPALRHVASQIEGFESPFGMELLATVDWLTTREGVAPKTAAVKDGLKRWKGPEGSAERKCRLFDDRMIDIALKRLGGSSRSSGPA